MARRRMRRRYLRLGEAKGAENRLTGGPNKTRSNPGRFICAMRSPSPQKGLDAQLRYASGYLRYYVLIFFISHIIVGAFLTC